MPARPICFVISPIGKDGSEIRARSDKVLKHIITPVADECGYDVIRADNISEPGMITTQIVNHILNDHMVVADLTDHNANVFYELAVRHAVRKPYVQIIQTGQIIPFDVAGMRTISVDHTDLDSVADAKIAIKDQMLATTATEANMESPISVAIDLEGLRRSGDPAKLQLADVLNALSELKALIDKKLPDRLETNLTRSSFEAWRRANVTNPRDPNAMNAFQEAILEILKRQQSTDSGDDSEPVIK